MSHTQARFDGLRKGQEREVVALRLHHQADHGAGLDVAVLRAAFADPAAALGGCDALLLAPTAVGAVRGMLVCFGRHADPDVKRFDSSGIAGTLVGVKGLPGGICGWNDSGLMVLAVRDAGIRDWSAQIACESSSQATSGTDFFSNSNASSDDFVTRTTPARS